MGYYRWAGIRMFSTAALTAIALAVRDGYPLIYYGYDVWLMAALANLIIWETVIAASAGEREIIFRLPSGVKEGQDISGKKYNVAVVWFGRVTIPRLFHQVRMPEGSIAGPKKTVSVTYTPGKRPRITGMS
jgi:hypothetical protein